MRASVNQGFTLIEVVIALAILALASAVLYESFGWSLRRTAVLKNQEAAWATAQSLLAQIRSRQMLQLGSEQGRTPEGLDWAANIQAHDLASDQYSQVRAFDVTISVSWGARPAQQVVLRSIETSRTT